MQLKNGDQVKYVGPTDRTFRVVQGQIYTVSGLYPQPPLRGWVDRDEIHIYVDDPRDDFGGVVSLPANQFREAGVNHP